MNYWFFERTYRERLLSGMESLVSEESIFGVETFLTNLASYCFCSLVSTHVR
jgi:hypothetical protein